MTVGINTTTGLANVVEREDFSPSALICDAGGLLEPTVRKDATLSGNGSTANPLSVNVSGDAGNQIALGTDGAIFVPAPPATNFNLSADAGADEAVTDTDTVEIAGGSSLSTIVSAPDTVTVNLDLSADAGNQAVLGTDGNIFVPAPAASTFNLSADAGTDEVVTDSDTVEIAGGSSLSTVVSAPDTVTVNLDLSADAGNQAVLGTDGNLFVPAAALPTRAAECPSGYFTGAPV